MERLYSDEPVPAHLRGAIVALGNFDGFHLGHQAVVGRAVRRAAEGGRPVIVATFDPHPARFFRPDALPFRLTTLDQRERLFAAAGASAMLVFRFDAAMAATSAQDFVRMLVEDVGAVGVVTGADFTFGKARTGSVATLTELGAAMGFVVKAVDPITDAEGLLVSSSRIRSALVDGDCATATRLLTRPFTIEGEVVHGDKVGREWGFPTANLLIARYLRPAYGVYAVRGRLPDGTVLDGAANLGIRPQFDVPKELLEPHFFDFSGNLYGQCIEVELIHRIRGEEKFDSFEALKGQIGRDCEIARHILADHPRLA
ncbi:bifunctional riboflavin kinase/FAD synthetase [Sphingobium sufflavum]|uniref:bifunctional riboflavin kinase/FAD synthetase n=1 Tax=Sphingobium sufflavum TaxID=1129547 RepID=UPI001F012F49|nr:bifunctional riboflavin kinase/FAD synthetase [Sphingobium sufflavum]MCE7797733.1 bifunctional riboflavin kinase/FAD synthetase [Sphingobium sufflavum]